MNLKFDPFCLSTIIFLISIFVRPSVNGHKFYSKFFSPVRELVCSGQATEEQLDLIMICRKNFRRSILFPQMNPEIQSKRNDCLSMDFTNQILFPVKEKYKDIVYSVCALGFQQCFFRAINTRVPKPQISRRDFQNYLSTVIQCQKNVLENTSKITNSSSLSSES